MVEAAKQPIDPQVTEMMKAILADNKITHQEFSQLSSKITELSIGRAKTEAEVLAIRQAYEKAMADNALAIETQKRLTEEYKAQVPGHIFKETLNETNEKNLTMLKWFLVVTVVMMVMFFSQPLMEALQGWLLALLG